MRTQGITDTMQMSLGAMPFFSARYVFTRAPSIIWGLLHDETYGIRSGYDFSSRAADGGRGRQAGGKGRVRGRRGRWRQTHGRQRGTGRVCVRVKQLPCAKRM